MNLPMPPVVPGTEDLSGEDDDGTGRTPPTFGSKTPGSMNSVQKAAGLGPSPKGASTVIKNSILHKYTEYWFAHWYTKTFD